MRSVYRVVNVFIAAIQSERRHWSFYDGRIALTGGGRLCSTSLKAARRQRGSGG